MNLTEEQKSEIKTNCLDDLCEDMSYPTYECLSLTDLAEIHIQGLMTCKDDTTLAPCTEELQRAGERYLIDLYSAVK